MKIKLDIISYYDERFDCIQNVLYSLLQKVVLFPQLILFGSWNFKFMEDEMNENYINNCLQTSKLDTITNCEEFFRLRFDLLKTGDGEIDTIIESLEAKEYILTELDTKQITWELNQDLFMREHYCLIYGIDTESEVIFVMDTNAVNHNQCVIPFSQLSMIKNIWKIDMTGLRNCTYYSKDIIGKLIKQMNPYQILEEENKYLNYLKNNTIDMRKELKGYEDKIAFCPFMWNLYNLGTGRYQTSRLIDHLNTIKSEYSIVLDQVVIGLMELAKSWEDTRNLFVKYAIRGNKLIYQRIIVHTEKIVEKEREILIMVGEYDNENR